MATRGGRGRSDEAEMTTERKGPDVSPAGEPSSPGASPRLVRRKLLQAAVVLASGGAASGATTSRSAPGRKQGPSRAPGQARAATRHGAAYLERTQGSEGAW